ncbi:unnamed protein product [Rhizophagus irregularis]|nr:unnamed protein product [Rhizophagus irregularis]
MAFSLHFSPKFFREYDNIHMDDKITKLAHTLQSQEQYIKYLYGVIEGHESEIEELRQKNAELRAKLKKALETASLKEEGLQALEHNGKTWPAIPPDPITEILNNRTTIANSVAGIRIHLDRTTIAAHPHINHLFNTANDSLDAIIRYANELRNIIEDQDNMEDRLEGLLDDVHNREEYLRRELNNTRATILRTRRTYEDAYANELMSRENVMRVEEMLIDYYSAIILKQSEVEGGLMVSFSKLEHGEGQFLNCRNHGQKFANQVNNLNQQILALQNNPPVIQQPIMAGYAPKKFRGASGEDPELWLQEFRQWVRDWYETHIKGKNWECVNLLDNTGVANLAAFNALNNGAIQAVAANQFRGGAGVLHGQAAAVNTITGANFIPDHTVWD